MRMEQTAVTKMTTDWVRYARVEDVPVGPALDYLTLLALHFGQHIKAVTGLTKGSVFEMIHQRPEPFDECSVKAMIGIYYVETCQTVDGTRHRATLEMLAGEGATQAEAVKRVVCMKRLAGMHLNVPTNLPDPQYENWVAELLADHVYRSTLSGKSATMRLLPWQQLTLPGGSARVALAEADYQLSGGKVFPEGYLERLTEQASAAVPTLNLDLSALEDRFVTHDKRNQNSSFGECLACDAGIPYSHTPTGRISRDLHHDVLVVGGSNSGTTFDATRRTIAMAAGVLLEPKEKVKIGIVGDVGSQHVRDLISGMDGYEIVYLDSHPDELRRQCSLPDWLQREQIPSIGYTGTIVRPDPRDGDPHHNWRGRYPTNPYLPARYADKKKAKRKQARAQRKSNNRSTKK